MTSAVHEQSKGAFNIAVSFEELGFFDYDTVPPEYEPLYVEPEETVFQKPNIPQIDTSPEIESIFREATATRASDIARLVCHHYRSNQGAVRYRANPFLDQELLHLLRNTFKKPFFKSWQKWLPDCALKSDPIFEMLASRILLTRNVASEYSNLFWDGKGHFQPGVNLANIASFSGAAAFFVFSISLDKGLFDEVESYLDPV